MSDEGQAMPAAQAIVPVREQTVDFYGDALPAGQLLDGTILVPLRPICDALGVAWSPQRARVRRDAVLREAQGVIIMITPGGPQGMLALPIELLPGWLFGISATRVKPELQAKILRYQRECFRVLWDAFKGDVLPAAAPMAAGIGELSGAALALEIATAVQHLARQQLDIEQRLGDLAGRHEALTGYLRPFVEQTHRALAEHNNRLTALELQLSAGATVSEDQAAEIALAVKNVGQRLAAQGDRNGYAKVYSEMYRRYRISSYKNLPAARYEEVLAWLAGWHKDLSA